MPNYTITGCICFPLSASNIVGTMSSGFDMIELGLSLGLS